MSSSEPSNGDFKRRLLLESSSSPSDILIMNYEEDDDCLKSWIYNNRIVKTCLN